MNMNNRIYLSFVVGPTIQVLHTICLSKHDDLMFNTLVLVAPAIKWRQCIMGQKKVNIVRYSYIFTSSVPYGTYLRPANKRSCEQKRAAFQI